MFTENKSIQLEEQDRTLTLVTNEETQSVSQKINKKSLDLLK